jgi:hypothetical protein
MTSPSPDKMARDLAGATQAGLDWTSAVLALPIDDSNSALLRAQSAAAGIAINAQLRADSLRMRSAREDKALDRLCKLIEEKALVVPVSLSDSPIRP